MDTVTVEVVVPIHLGVTHQVVLLTEERADFVIHALVYAVHIIAGHTVHGHIILFVGVDQMETEHAADKQILVDVHLRSDVQSQETVVEVVLMFSVSILEDGRRIGQLPVGFVRLHGRNVVHIILIVHIEMLGIDVAAVGIGHETVRAQHRRLGAGQEVERCHRLVLIAGRRTLIHQLTSLVGVSGIKAHRNNSGQFHVSVEADVQAIQIVLLERAVGTGITHGEHIVCHITATAHAQGVALRHSVAINFITPIGVALILVEVGIGLTVLHIGLEETEILGPGAHRTNHGGSIILELRSVHHAVSRRNQLHADIGRSLDTGGHGLVATGGDFNHTVTALGTVKRRTIGDYLDVLHIIGVDVGEHVIVKTVVQIVSVVLHVDGHTVQHNQRLGVGVQRSHTVHFDVAADTGHTASGTAVEEALQLIADFVHGINGRRELHAGG